MERSSAEVANGTIMFGEWEERARAAEVECVVDGPLSLYVPNSPGGEGMDVRN